MQIFNPVIASSGGTSGGGGSKNYLAAITTSNGANTGNGDFELNATTGWSKGTVTLTGNLPTGVPTFSSGSSANLSIATVASGVLAGSFSLKYASSAATVAGDFLTSDAFNIDTEDQAKVLTFKFYYQAQANPTNGNWSGTTSNSFGVAIYDVTNSAWIIPAGVFSMTQSTGMGYATGTFQTTSNSTAYRIVVYNANASSGAITLYFDDMQVGPQTAPYGPIVTDWRSFTLSPSTGSFGSIAVNNAQWRRVGDSMELLWQFRQTGTGTAGSGTYAFTIPSPYTIDSTKFTTTTSTATNRVIGVAQVNDNTNFYIGNVTVLDGSQTQIAILVQTSAVADAFWGSGLAALSGSTISAGFMAKIPITGWSSNVQMSNDTDTRVVALRSNGATASLSGSYADVTWTTIVNDTHGTMGAISYTIPVSGYYDVATQILTTGTFALNGAAGIQVLKNGSVVQEADFIAGGAITGNVAVPLTINAVFCNAGDTLKVQFKSGATLPTVVTSTSDNFLTISRRSGPAVVAATESVGARYFASATAISGSLATVVWTTKDFDTHNAMSSGLYTIPVSGKYQVNSNVQIAGTIALNSSVDMQLQKNSTAVSEFQTFAGGAMTAQNGQISDEISCVAGDVIRIQISSSATLPTISAGNTKVFFSIGRVGN